MISFAGGLPNPISFPQEALKESMDRVVAVYGSRVFQYSTTAGLASLREYIAEKYRKQYQLEVASEDIIIRKLGKNIHWLLVPLIYACTGSIIYPFQNLMFTGENFSLNSLLLSLF